MYKKTIILSLLGAATISIAQLPPAASIINALAEEKTNSEQEQLLAQYLEERASVTTKQQESALWVDTFQKWSQTYLQHEHDWSAKNALMDDLAALGRYFPAKAEWPALKASIQRMDPDHADPALTALSFLIAVLENDEASAIAILHAKTGEPGGPQPVAQGKNGRKGIAGALMSISNSSYAYSRGHRQGASPLVQMALDQDNMPQLQKNAYEYAIADTGPRAYRGKIPDLKKLYSGQELASRVSELMNALGDNIRPRQIPESLIPDAYAYIKENDLVPDKQFLRILDPESPTYAEDLAYYEKKHAAASKDDQPNEAQVRDHLMANQVDPAWNAWKALAEKDPKKAGNLLRNLFGFSSRSYPREALNQFALRILELSERPEVLDTLQNVIPLENEEEDPLLKKVRDLIDATDNPTVRAEYAKIEIDRLLAIGLEAQAVVAAERLLDSPDESLRQLFARQSFRGLITYAKAFHLLEREELGKRFIEVAARLSAALSERDKDNYYSAIADYYMENGEYQAAFEALEAAVEATDRKAILEGRTNLSSKLTDLLYLYTTSAQPEDAIALLDQAIGWQGTDLIHLDRRGGGENVKVIAARAFHALGQSGLASDILRDYLRYERNSDDDAYELLLAIEGKAAGPFLDELAAEAPFEERPLIWQALLLHKSGQHKAAEEMARAAIAIDPTDGEMNESDRLRAYAVLRDVLIARDEEEGEVFEQIVAAVDLSEVADQYRRAGLASHALELYQESMHLFADAYCVRFRAAVELEAAGKYEEANKHFENAYSLMPDQFGRIESHCFGCEGAFEGKRAQSIAERVFTRMLIERPEKASLHYLMGYLNNSRNRNDEALANFREAVTLDPLYYNAWAKIQSLGDRFNDPELSLEATKAMLEIAPRRSLSSVSRLSLGQMGRIWETGEQILPILPPRSESIYPLDAMQELRDSEEGRANRSRMWSRHSREIHTAQSMGALLFENRSTRNFLEQSLRAAR